MGLSRGSGSWLRISCRRLSSLFTRVQVLHKRKKSLQTTTSPSPGGTASSGRFGFFISAFSEPRSAAEQLGSASRAGAPTGRSGPCRATPAPHSREPQRGHKQTAAERRVIRQRGAPHCLEPAAAGDPQPGAELCSRCGADSAWRSGTGCRRGLPPAPPSRRRSSPIRLGGGICGRCGAAAAAAAAPPPLPGSSSPLPRALRAGPGRTPSCSLSPGAVPSFPCHPRPAAALSLTSLRCGSAAAAPGAGPAGKSGVGPGQGGLGHRGTAGWELGASSPRPPPGAALLQGCSAASA